MFKFTTAVLGAHGGSYLDRPIPLSGYSGGGTRVKGGMGYGYRVNMPWNSGYSFFRGSLTAPIRPGGVPDKFIKLWPENHFNLTDYTKRIGYWNVLKAYAQSWLFFGTFVIRFPTILVAWVFGRRYMRQWEPTEQKMDPEVYFRDYESNHSAVDFDHHRFNHRMAKRRAVKWGYADQVPQLFEDDHHH